ncbi:MAG TPA: translation initiation factor IF-2 N-terminal domain-containing protein, partial [Geobacteraceae bacterium]|nr:translation initiation factor IF-2 N-terminal domain-containing protein [Geobacteraceae bacterium]
MTKIRVYELAQKMGIENKELMARLKAMGVDVKSHTASIEEADVKNLLAAAPPSVAETPPAAREVSKEEVRVTTTIIRRRAKVVEPTAEVPAPPVEAPKETEAPPV